MSVEDEFFKKGIQREKSSAIQAEALSEELRAKGREKQATVKTFHAAPANPYRGVYLRSWWIAFILCLICYVLGLISQSPWFSAGLFFCLLVGLYHFAGYDEQDQHAGRGAIRGSIAVIVIGPLLTVLVVLCVGAYLKYEMSKEKANQVTHSEQSTEKIELPTPQPAAPTPNPNATAYENWKQQQEYEKALREEQAKPSAERFQEDAEEAGLNDVYRKWRSEHADELIGTTAQQRVTRFRTEALAKWKAEHPDAGRSTDRSRHKMDWNDVDN